MNGVQLGARFSIATNRLKYCGPADAEPSLYAAITRGEGLGPAEEALSRFEALHPYLEAIASKHRLHPFDHRVVEAYWIGNSLLDTFEPSDFRRILQALTRRGLPSFVARELEQRLPTRPVPHHVFHVCFVGVGAVTGHVKTTLPNMDACRPAAAEVLDVVGERVQLSKPALELRGGHLALGQAQPVELAFDPLTLPGLARGDRIAVHWGWPAVQLTETQGRDLEAYTRASLAAANEARPPP